MIAGAWRIFLSPLKSELAWPKTLPIPPTICPVEVPDRPAQGLRLATYFGRSGRTCEFCPPRSLVLPAFSIGSSQAICQLPSKVIDLAS